MPEVPNLAGGEGRYLSPACQEPSKKHSFRGGDYAADRGRLILLRYDPLSPPRSGSSPSALISMRSISSWVEPVDGLSRAVRRETAAPSVTVQGDFVSAVERSSGSQGGSRPMPLLKASSRPV